MATRYWVGGAGNWSSTTKWSTTSGGASGASVPISTDDVVFDVNSGLVAAIATVDTAQTCATLTLTPGATVGFSTIAITASLTVTGLFSMSGTAGNQRFQIRGTTYGIATNFIVGSASGLSDLDFRDLFVTGAAAPLSGTRIGDLRGVSGVTFSMAKTVYWVTAAGGNWSGNNWSNTVGGAANTNYFPLAQDTATFAVTGLTSGNTVTIDAAIPYTGSVDMSLRTTALMTLAIGTVTPTIYGDWINGTGTTLSGTGTITFSGRNTQSITSAGKAFTQPITTDTYGGTVQLVDGLNIGANPITITNGTFITNGQTISANSFSSSNSNVRAIDLGASAITLVGANPIAFTTSTNMTFNAGTSTINCTSTSAVTVNGGGLSFNNLSFAGTTAVTHVMTGANTFTNLTFTAPAAAGLMQCTFSANQTITGALTCAGASAIRRIFLRSDTVGTQRTLTCGAVSAQDCDFRDIALAGAAAPYNASTLRVGDCGGNSGITFPAAKTVYWNLAGAQNWSATGWATSSGGTPAVNNFPLAQDTAVFDNTGSVTGIISINTAWNIGTFDASARTTAMTLTNSGNSPLVYGNWKFGTGVISTTTTGAIIFGGRTTQTITSNGVAFGCSITIDSSTGTVQLADAFATGTTRTLTVNSGTFDAVTSNVTAGLFTATSAVAGSVLAMGTGTWTLSGTGTVWGGLSANINFIKGTANILLSDTSTTARTFVGGGFSYNKLTNGGTTGLSTLNITGSNQFTELASVKTVYQLLVFDAASTTTFGAWTISGSAGNLVEIDGAGATFIVAGARVSGVNYINVVNTVTVSPTSPGEFYAGPNSTGIGIGFINTAAPASVTRYWRGGTGTWDATTTTNWSATSGGVGGASVPTSADAVVFDTLSNATAYTVTCTATQLRCASLTMAGPATGNITWAGSAPLAIHGNVTLPATGMTRTYTGAITLTGSATGKTFTTNGVALASAVTVNGVGCGWALGFAFTNTSTLTVTNGAFDTANYSFTTTTITSVNRNSRTISLGSSAVTCSINSGTPIGFSTATNLTFNAGTSTITISGNTVTFAGGGQTFYNVSFTGNGVGTTTITGSNSFAGLSLAGITTAGLRNTSFSANQTISGTFTISAGTDATMRNFLQSDTIGTTRTLTCGSISAQDVDFRDIAIAGAAAPYNASTLRIGDCKGNSGITFAAGVPKYWNLAAGGNWGGAIAWATTSGGTPAINNFPLAQDTAWIESTGLTSGNTITMNAAYNIGTINMAGRTTNTMILATGTTNPFVYGNWINGSGCSFTGTSSTLTFAGRGSQTITSAGVAFTQGFVINSPGGSVTLADAVNTSTNGITHTSGTFNAVNYNVSTATFSTSNSNVRTVAIGTGTWTLSGTAPWAATTSTNLTVTGTGTIKLTSGSIKTFAGGSVAYTNITLDQGGAGQITISGNNTFGNITNTSGVANTINFAATTTTLSQFTAAGTAGNLLTIQGTSAGSPATLIYSGAGNVNVGYLTINNVRGYPL